MPAASAGTGDFDSLRIEQEDKISIPLEKADEVWAYLNKRYIENVPDLKKADALLSFHASDEDFVDIYFDSPDLKLLSMKSGVRHRRRVNLTNPKDIKNNRELMQIKVSKISANYLERGEFKYAVQYPKQPRSPDDQHPMLGPVKPSQREEFKKRLTAMGLVPYQMKPILTVTDHRKRLYILRSGKPFISISVDHATGEALGKSVEFVEIEPELNEVAFTEADPAMRKFMESTNAAIIDDIMAAFPSAMRDLTPKYNKAFERLEARTTFFRFRIRVGANGLFTAAVLGIFLAGSAVWILRRRRTAPKAETAAGDGR